jgi:Spy/CpxP family protein refolding chaperone
MTWMILCAALALPVAAWAQHGAGHPVPHAPTAPEPAGYDAPLPGDGDEDWLAADLPEGDLLMDDAGPGGDRRVFRHRMRASGRHGGGHGGFAMHRRFASLDLTEAQRDKMRELHEAAQRKSIQRNADMQMARLDLHKLMRADAPNAQAVNAQIDKMSKLRADGMKAHYETFLQARALLTPEQLQQLKQPPVGKQKKQMKSSPGDASGGL